MAVSVVCVGKLRESYFSRAASEYVMRLSRLMPVDIAEVADEPEPPSLSQKLAERAIAREGERILARVPDKARVIALCVGAPQMTSEALAAKIKELQLSGRGDICFVIGGSMGLSGGVLKRADERMGLSLMTFPHQLARVMLLEQLYRAAKINAGERYHK